MKLNKFAGIGVGILLSASASAAVVVDSFTEDSFTLDTENSAVDANVDLAFAERRVSQINTEFAQSGTTMNSTLDAGSGSLSFSVDGTTTNQNRPLRLQLGYFQGGPYDISGYNAYEFDFQNISGTGFLIVELALAASDYSRPTIRVTLDSSGTVTVPFDSVNVESPISLDSFPATHITFEAESEQFSFVLDEVRVVPEPSSMLLLGIGISGLLTRRRMIRTIR